MGSIKINRNLHIGEREETLLVPTMFLSCKGG